MKDLWSVSSVAQGDTLSGLISLSQVRPFIEKFRGPNGLRKVVVKGVSHEKSLAQLKKGLLREGGIFEALEGST